MVSKIAVIALVAIVAVPILLGYAFNLTEVTETDYRTTGEDVNVTPLLQNGVGYSYTQADVYNLNTNFDQGYIPTKVLPAYTTTTTKTSMFTQKFVYSNGQYQTGARPIAPYSYVYYSNDYNGDITQSGYLTVQIWDTAVNAQFASMLRFHTFYWDSMTSKMYVTAYPSDSDRILISQVWDIDDPSRYTYRFIATQDMPGNTLPAYTGNSYLERGFLDPSGETQSYVDFAAGYKLEVPVKVPDNSGTNDGILNTNKIGLNLPEYPNNVLLTMDLNTITDSSYQMIFDLKGYGLFENYFTLTKSTDSSGTHWEFYRGRPYSGYNKVLDLYYDSDRLSNTYQIYIDNTGIEFRYVGNWPTLIGEANYFQKFRYDRDFSYYIGGLKKINFWTDTPKMRVDYSEYRAFEYPVIEDQVYKPSDFKTNPATTISGNVVYGRSLTFGSNTYTVTDGNITMGTHKIPVKGMVLDSVPNDHGSYDNRINGTKVSESANPATITFNGKWSASITSIDQEIYTYSKTEWKAGQFGWDGMDHNFLLVGLLTSFGVFIALGIYARKTRSGGLMPLIIVTGCATVLFFILL